MAEENVKMVSRMDTESFKGKIVLNKANIIEHLLEPFRTRKGERLQLVPHVFTATDVKIGAKQGTYISYCVLTVSALERVPLDMTGELAVGKKEGRLAGTPYG